MASRRVTLRDVARRAGVSTTTVSDALNERGRLPDATRGRVSAVAEELGYRPNVTARHLRLGRAGLVALYCPLVAGMPAGLAGTGYYMELAMGAADAALRDELAVVLLPPRLTPERLAGIDVDGVVIADPVRDDPAVAALRARRVPVVTCERDPTAGAQHAGCVESDHVAALRGLLDHLADQGATRPALIAPGDETAWGAALSAGFVGWCGEHGVTAREERIPLAPDPRFAARATEHLLATAQPPDAIVVAPDGGAAEVVRVLAARGVSVPGDVLVASCVDGATMISSRVPVTSIDLQPGLAGARAARLLAAILGGGKRTARVEQLPTRLVVRASTTRRPIPATGPTAP